MNLSPCFCGSANSYEQCCQPFHSGQIKPPTAEALMRSRYSAFELALESYILDTWDPKTRPKHADLSTVKTEWQRLEVIDCKKGQAIDNKGIVEFKAYYRLDEKDFTLHEVSRFIKQQGRWFYLDGVVKSLAKPGQTTNFGLNAPCPCGSGKKYKRCCGSSK
jgi:SEC-C motif domain protein